MKKTRNAVKMLPQWNVTHYLMLILFIISASMNVFGAGINLLSPLNLDKCVVEGEINFTWTYDNPTSSPITDVVINIYKDTTTLILSETLADDAVNYSLNTMDISGMDARFAYKWEVFANINGLSVKATRYYYLIPTPKFSANSLPNDTHCISTSLTLDWTPAIPEYDYFYEVQVSKYINFDILVDVNLNETSATMELENNSHYYWRLRDLDCPNNFSEIREFYTVHLPVTLLEPGDKTQCEVVEYNFRLTTKLSWSSDTALSSVNYKLEIRNAVNDTLILETTLLTNEYEFDVTDLLDKEIKWRVQLAQYTGTDYCNTSWSETYSFYTPIEAPEILSPRNDNCVPSKAEFRWRDSLNDKIEILISKNVNFTDTVVYESVDNNESCIIDLPEYSRQYFYKIRAKALREDDSYVYSLWSEVAEFTTTIAGPKLVSPADNTSGVEEFIELVWRKTPMADSYRLDICSDTNFTTSSKIFQSFYIKDTFFMYPVKIDVETDYYWRVRGIQGNQNTCYSDYEIRSFSTALEIPVAVYPVNEDTTHNNNIKFSWNQVNHATKYDLEYSTDKSALENNNYAKIISLNNIVDTAFSVYMLNYETDYYWRIKAKNAKGATSPWSKIYTFNTGNVTPDKVELVSPANKGKGSPFGIYIWKVSANANKYQIQVSDDSTFTSSYVIYKLVNDTTFEFDCNDTMIKKDYIPTYYWRVRAMSVSAGNTTYSEWSDIWKFTNAITEQPETIELIAPLNNATTEYYDNITFSWNKINGAKEYRLMIGYGDEVYIDTFVVNTQITINKLNKNTPYQWVVGVDEHCWFSAASEMRNFTTSDVSSILDNTILNSMSIIPNPAGNVATLRVNTIETGTTSIVITDISGGVVLSNNIDLNTGDNIINIDAIKLSTGNYTVSLYFGGKLVGFVSLVIAR
jgi:hypothetical protein